MNANSFALAAAFAIVLLGLGILLGAEAVGATDAFVIGGGFVTLAGVGIITAVIMRLPHPDPEHGGDGDHDHV
ncbi:hypothetical protein [Haloferax sp. YSSS75]|uniref:hypothetical protein n=1 Tax=Haloferax sp. YSSS75 TaxID=3388564 RepID=UPI00398CBAE9